RRNRRRREVGLPRAQVDHVLARRLTALRLLRDRDGGGRLEVLKVGRQAEARALGHERLAPKRFRTATVQDSHGRSKCATSQCGVRNAECGMSVPGSNRGPRIDATPSIPHSEFRIPHWSPARCALAHQKLASSAYPRPLTTEDRVTLDEAKAALARGRHLVLVTPPAPEQAGELWELLAPPPPDAESGAAVPAAPAALIICSDDVSAAEWAAAAPIPVRVHAATGPARP